MMNKQQKGMEGNDSFCALFLARIVVGHPFRNSASHVLWYSFVRAQAVADSCVADQTGCQRVLNDPDNGPCCPNNDLSDLRNAKVMLRRIRREPPMRIFRYYYIYEI
ncbi:hypothetical protein [uncultured Prevotella sp.]|uniref:hypothetical protein n=1 Tax=uncultured Prevotella sp. TaxID=159272 RepID=UPI00258802EA|nr:hypothetical protein [uncultured Prevotella sp.]